MFGNIYGVHPSGTSIQRSGSPRGTFLGASANLIRNRGIHIDYLAHAQWAQMQIEMADYQKKAADLWAGAKERGTRAWGQIQDLGKEVWSGILHPRQALQPAPAVRQRAGGGPC